jgi:heat shock protein HtpX
LLFIFAIAFVILIFVPVTALLTRIMLSGKKDYHADAEAVMLTRYPEGLARALEKMANDPEPLEVSNKAMAHMYIVDPLTRKKGAAPNWLSRLFTTHAPVEKRVEALRAM